MSDLTQRDTRGVSAGLHLDMPARTRPFTDARVLIVDDQPKNVLLLRRILEREGFSQIKTTTDSREVLALFAAFDPDILLLDLHMPYVDGFAVMRQIAEALGEDSFVPTVVLTADVSTSARDTALSVGAQDFLTKPFDPVEVVLRVRNLLNTRWLHLRLAERADRLRQQADLQRGELDRARIEVLARLARTVDLRDNETFAHTRRVGELSARLGQRLGLSVADIDLLRQAAPLHDIGKIGISDAVLLKPGPLTDEEFDHIRTHTTIGAELLADSEILVLRVAQRIALGHHERWDGTGYPHGTRGLAIPIEARIAAVADVFDALTHWRPYKQAWPLERALGEITHLRGKHFDPDVVDAFLDMAAREDLLLEDVEEDRSAVPSRQWLGELSIPVAMGASTVPGAIS
jgi:putative two-component system response regulator